jgi:hypothetical protein
MGIFKKTKLIFLLLPFLIVACGEESSSQEKVANISVRLGVNTVQSNPSSVSTFDTRNLHLKRYEANKNLHFLISFFATANLSNYQEVEVKLALPHHENLLVFFQFGVHTPRMEVIDDLKWFYFDFTINSNQAFVFTLLPLNEMIIPVFVESIHELTGIPNGLPSFEVYENEP